MKKLLAALLLLATAAQAAPLVDPSGAYYATRPARVGTAQVNSDQWLVDNREWTYATPERIATETAAIEAAAALAAEAAAVTLAESLDTAIDASQLKALLLSAVKALPESEQAELPTFFPAWRPGTAYAVSNKLQFDGQLYRVIQAHTSQMDWTPDTAASLFASINPPGVVSEWVQPESTNPYQTGDQVTYGGQTWTSTADNNVWAPGVYGWVVAQ